MLLGVSEVHLQPWGLATAQKWQEGDERTGEILGFRLCVITTDVAESMVWSNIYSVTEEETG